MTTLSVDEVLQIKFDRFVNKMKEIAPEFSEAYSKMNDDYVDQKIVTGFFFKFFPDENYLAGLNLLLSFQQLTLTDEQKEKIIPVLEDHMNFLRKINSDCNIL